MIRYLSKYCPIKRTYLRRTATASALVALAMTAIVPTARAQTKHDAMTVALGATDMGGRNLDPAATAAGLNMQVLYQIYDTLFKFDRTGRPIPWLVAQDTVSADGRTHTLKLRDDVFFHDGSGMTADDVKFSLDRARGVDPNLPSPTSKSYTASIDSVEVAGPTTVVLNLKYADPILYNNLAYQPGMILPKAYLEKVGVSEFQKKPIGTGPYAVADVQLGQYVKLQAFGRYWGAEKPHIEQVTFRQVAEGASRVAQLQAGDADFIFDVDPTQIESLRDADLKVISNPVGEHFAILLNGKTPGLSDPRVGQALNLAVNRAAIIDKIYRKNANLIASLDNAPAYIDPNLKPFSYDPERAKKLLAEAGFDKSQALVLYIPIGRYPKGEEVAEAVSSDLQKIGIKLQIKQADYGTWVKDYVAKNVGAMIYASAPNTTNDPGPIMEQLLSCGKTYSVWCDAELDTRFAHLDTASGEARGATLRQIDQYLQEKPPAIYLVGFNQINAMKPTIDWKGVPGSRYVFLTDISFSK